MSRTHIAPPQPRPDIGVGYLSTNQVASLLGMTRQGVAAAVRRGEIKAVKIGCRLLFPLHSLPGHGHLGASGAK